jgi:lipopolysaccharide transport system permease protein
MIALVREATNYRELLFIIAWREIKIKYKQSVLGFMWAILMPTIIVSAGILVRYAFSLTSGKPLVFNDIASVSVKAIPWAFIVSSIRFASTSLIGNANLVTKIYMPREVFPIASILSQLVDFAVASLVLVVLLAIAQIGLSVYILWVPLLLIILITFCTGVALFVSAASLFFRDVKYLVDVIITFAIFFTPVFYESSMFGDWGKLLLLNPVAPILEGLNDCIVYHRAPAAWWILYSGIVSIVGTAGAFVIFKKLEPAFAESI